tara:strand:- start:298 stop:405 length:108 start_codon:yes stop_codon:yes gene_type:complete
VTINQLLAGFFVFKDKNFAIINLYNNVLKGIDNNE